MTIGLLLAALAFGVLVVAVGCGALAVAVGCCTLVVAVGWGAFAVDVGLAAECMSVVGDAFGWELLGVAASVGDCWTEPVVAEPQLTTETSAIKTRKTWIVRRIRPPHRALRAGTARSSV